MSNSKKYIITAVTLCAIGAVSAVCIAGANLLTEKRIEENTRKAKEEALSEIYENADFSDARDDFKGEETKYLVNYYVATDKDTSEELGYVYYVDGRNAYGEIAMMVGVNAAGIGQFSIVTNTQSFATTLEDNYIVKYQAGERELDDTSCGATYGATLIKNMAEQASADYTAQKGGN